MKNKKIIATVVGVIVVFSFFIIGNKFYPFESSSGSNGTGNVSDNNSEKLQSGLRVEDLSVGQGKTVGKSDTVVVHYTGFLTDGSKFDDSRGRGTPFEVELGKGLLIRGFEEGVLGMKTGGLRRITIPPELGYGNQAVGPIPANSTLIFEVEVLEIKSQQF